MNAPAQMPSTKPVETEILIYVPPYKQQRNPMGIDFDQRSWVPSETRSRASAPRASSFARKQAPKELLRSTLKLSLTKTMRRSVAAFTAAAGLGALALLSACSNGASPGAGSMLPNPSASRLEQSW